MNKELAKEVYIYVLINSNGWKKEDINENTLSYMEADPYYLGLLELEGTD
jgi:hypothetical protein